MTEQQVMRTYYFKENAKQTCDLCKTNRAAVRIQRFWGPMKPQKHLLLALRFPGTSHFMWAISDFRKSLRQTLLSSFKEGGCPWGHSVAEHDGSVGRDLEALTQCPQTSPCTCSAARTRPDGQHPPWAHLGGHLPCFPVS